MNWWSPRLQTHICVTWLHELKKAHIEGILPKGPYPPCLRIADWALWTGYPRYLFCCQCCKANYRTYVTKQTHMGKQKALWLNPLGFWVNLVSNCLVIIKSLRSHRHRHRHRHGHRHRHRQRHRHRHRHTHTKWPGFLFLRVLITTRQVYFRFYEGKTISKSLLIEIATACVFPYHLLECNMYKVLYFQRPGSSQLRRIDSVAACNITMWHSWD